MRRSDALNEQLQSALNSRVVIEQAKGKLAERLGLDMSEAFTVLRDHARSSNRRLSEVARAFVERHRGHHRPATTTGQVLVRYVLRPRVLVPRVLVRRASDAARAVAAAVTDRHRRLARAMSAGSGGRPRPSSGRSSARPA